MPQDNLIVAVTIPVDDNYRPTKLPPSMAYNGISLLKIPRHMM